VLREIGLCNQFLGGLLGYPCELNAEGLLCIQGIASPEQSFRCRIKIERRCLELRAELIVNASRHLMLDFVTDADQEP